MCVPNILTTSSVVHTSVQVSLNWASGLIPLGCLHPRPLRYFHSLGLQTGLHHRVVQTRQSLPTYSGTGRACLFSPLESLYHDLYRRLYTGLGRPYEGFPDFEYSDPFRPQPVYQLFGTQSGYTGLQCHQATGPPSYDRYGQHRSSVLYQQTGWHPFPHPVMSRSSSGSVPMALNSGHSHHGQAHSRLSERDSRTPISAESEWSLHPEIMNRIFGTWGTPTVDMFATFHNTHLPQFVSNSRASSTGDRCSVHRFPCSTKSFRNSGPPRRAR